MSERRRWVKYVPVSDEEPYGDCFWQAADEDMRTDVEVLAEMGGERMWWCSRDHRTVDFQWCGHRDCGWVWVVKEGGDE